MLTLERALVAFLALFIPYLQEVLAAIVFLKDGVHDLNKDGAELDEGIHTASVHYFVEV